MDDLLPYYERELEFIRRGAKEFGARYPKIAARLQISDDGCDDPQVERMLEAFSLLSARVQKKLDDDFPELTESLLETMYPHYLRPFPSCSIAAFDAGSASSQISGVFVIPRGTELSTRPVKDVPCKFRTVYDVIVRPLRIERVVYAASAMAPHSVRLPVGATGCISVSFEYLSNQAEPENDERPVRIYLDGEPSTVAALRDALLQRVASVYVETPGSGTWLLLNHRVLSPVGMSDDEALFDWPASSLPAYRILTEYFGYPEKFNFVDIDLKAACSSVGIGEGRTSITLHFVLESVRADSNQARLLESISVQSMRMGCSPVINLFKQCGEPIRLSHASAAYAVLGDARRAYAFDVYSIDTVHLVKQTMDGNSITEFRPFYSLRHGETPDSEGRYWIARRDEEVAQRSPGYETEISIVDREFDPATPQVSTLSLDLTCTNRGLPATIAFGVAGGDLFLNSGGVIRSASFLRKPSAPCRFERERGALWRIVSHLALNHLSLSRGGLPALKEVLSLYDLPRSAINARMIDGIKSVEHQPATKWLAGKPFASIVRGLEIKLVVDEEAFVGAGVDLFGSVMDCFFGLYAHVNSFTQLVLVSHRNGEELMRCTPRAGTQTLG